MTAVAAFLVGGVMSEPASESADTDDRAEIEDLRTQVDELTDRLAAAEKKRERVSSAGRARHVSAEESKDTNALAADTGPRTDGSAPTFSLADATSGPEASREFMAFAEAQLGRGEAGHVAIIDAMSDVWTNREMVEKLFGDQTQAVRQLYPWIKFLVQHEEQVVGLSDYVFRTMADNPKAFEKIPNGNVLEIFTEGVGILLPGVVDDEQLAVFRGYARKILETPKDKQPEAIASIRGDLKRLVSSFWAEPLDPVEALERLKSGAVPAAEVGRLLRMLPPDMLVGLDISTLIAPALREGNRDAVRVLSMNPDLQLDAWKTDQAVLDGLAKGSVQPWFLLSYFSAVGHKEWTDVRPFFDRALGGGEKSLNAAVQALSQYLPQKMRPDSIYIEDVLSRFAIETRMAARLKAVYGIE